MKPFKNQVFDDLLSQHDESNLFEDPEFPAEDSSMYFSTRPPNGIRWLRPKVGFFSHILSWKTLTNSLMFISRKLPTMRNFRLVISSGAIWTRVNWETVGLLLVIFLIFYIFLILTKENNLNSSL